jgi:hypothetical protein
MTDAHTRRAQAAERGRRYRALRKRGKSTYRVQAHSER